MNNLQDKILNKIKEENLEPVSVKKILFKKYTIFVTLFFSVIFSILAFSALSFILANLDWFFYADLEENLPFFILRHFPFFWLILSGIFISLSIYIWHNTDKGYKYSGQYVAGILFCIIVFFGSLLNVFRIGSAMDSKFADPNLRPSFEEGRMQIWDRPDKKRLIGDIVEVNEEKQTFTLEAKNFLWDIKLDDIEDGKENVMVGNKIKLICRNLSKCIIFKFE